MGVAIDVSAVRSGGFTFRASPLAELVSALHVLMEPGHHPNRAGWAAAVAEGVEPHLLEQLLDLDYLWRASRADMFLPSRPADTLADELDDLDRLDDETWVSAAVLTSSCGTLPLDRSLGSPLNDARAAEVARARAGLRGPRQLALVEAIMAAPDRSRSRVRRVLEAAETAFFADMWRKLRPALVDDARRRHDVYQSEGLVRAVGSLSPAVTVASGSARIVVDKLQDDFAAADQGVMTFIPTVFGHPHLLVVHAPRWAPVLQYPIVGVDGAPYPASIQDVELRLRALDHPVRMRLVRSLVRGPKSTSELASIWGLATPEVSRHLATLKTAGLVLSTRQGRNVHHHVDTVVLASLGQDLHQALLR